MKKFLSLSLIIFASVLPVFSVTLEDMELQGPKPPAYRVGLTDKPENPYVEVKQNIEKKEVKTDIEHVDPGDLTYADLSIKKMSQEISKELELEEDDMMGDLSLLWQGAASKSDTISFALYKLANPDENKPDEKSVKKVLMNIASMSTLVGAGMGNPMLATGSILGSSVLGIFAQDTKALNYKYTKVTDADMIILIRKIEDLQQNTVNLYYDYMTAKKMVDLLTKVTEQRKKNYEASQEQSREIILITDAYYRTSIDDLNKARATFNARRAALEQFVGNDIFTQFEKALIERDKKND
ncbi:TPA: hypothetical protein IAC10_01515 [Candidatus Scatousia excrementigallinarum]|uniref:Uncharacterized protein n=1 Tax=Candidatus Scatousia excrementigallinarum TaxID=2840935 RepID=A0A9D1JLX5_9BACT|nr:hypothetical protein [Candidatus Scatousia excrementigallinarum]